MGCTLEKRLRESSSKVLSFKITEPVWILVRQSFSPQVGNWSIQPYTLISLINYGWVVPDRDEDSKKKMRVLVIETVLRKPVLKVLGDWIYFLTIIEVPYFNSLSHKGPRLPCRVPTVVWDQERQRDETVGAPEPKRNPSQGAFDLT